MLRRIKGQSVLEYALIIAVVVGALLAMQIYMRRGLQGRLRESSDQIGEQFDAANTKITRNINRTGITVQEVQSGVTTSYTGSGGKGVAEVRTEAGKDEVNSW